jgi:hypothetical protein
MGQITGKWFGIIDGTNKGQMVAEFTESPDGIVGQAVLYDIAYGDTRMRLAGSRVNNHIDITLTHFESTAPAVPGSGQAHVEVAADGNEIRGTWNTDIGTNGTMTLFRYAVRPQPPATAPLAFTTKVIPLPACILDRESLAGLVRVAMSRTLVLVPTFTVQYAGRTEIKLGIDTFFQDTALPSMLRKLSTVVSEPAVGMGYKALTLHFTEFDQNTLTLMADDPYWVEGKAQDISNYIQRHRAIVNNLYRKYGSRISNLVFLFMLAVAPSIPSLSGRFTFIGLIAAILWFLAWIYKRIFPSVTIFLRGERATWWQKYGRNVMGATAGVIFGGILALISNLFLKFWPGVLNWLTKIFNL